MNSDDKSMNESHDDEKQSNTFNYSKEDVKLKDIKIKPPKVSRLLTFKREAIFLSNFDFNLKSCPKCGSKLLIDDLFCYNCGTNVVNVEKTVEVYKKPIVSKLLTFKREAIFLSNFDFNLKSCPKCDSKLLIDDLFCYNCGEKVDEDIISENDNSH